MTDGSTDRSADRTNATFFARISRELMEQAQDVPTLRLVAEGAVEAVPGADWCGVSLRRRRHRVENVASTSPVADACDALQYELDEGPCLEAIWDSECYLADDIRTDPRWPRWGPRVAAEGVGSVLAIRLATKQETLGAINLYAARVGAFEQDDVDLALIYAVHATNAMNASRLVTGLQTAVQSRHTIGVAQGILMSRYGLSLDHSFEVLRRYSSHRNVKLHDLAASIVETGGLPGLTGTGSLSAETESDAHEGTGAS